MDKTYQQRGYNDKYPYEIVAWRIGEKVPQWLSDIAMIGAIDERTGNLHIATRDTKTGGIEILESSGRTSLVTTTSREDYVCKSIKTIGGVFSLTPTQFSLLYDSPENLNNE
jgi:hypothetical protein